MTHDAHSSIDPHSLPLTPAKSHIVSIPMLVAIWVLLCGLAFLSTFIAAVNIGSLNVLVEMVIASVMAIVAALYFMHLRYDNPFNIAAMLLSLIFITLFISFSLTDTTAYRSELIPGYAPAMQKAASAAAAPSTVTAKPAAPK